MDLKKKKANFGTAPVFFTAISTILGAIMFLRFGYAVGSVGFLGSLGIILFGHLVTIPTAMAIAEIATNQKVEGGGEYFIISRSFGINIGAAIGLALYMSQAISVAFYIIAFAEAFSPILEWAISYTGFEWLDKRIISVPAVVILSIVILKKGASLGMKALYVVVAILFISLIMFFLGTTPYSEAMSSFQWNDKASGGDSFFKVFAIVFPAFTGMTAGVGLSGDLKDPKKSIPYGTILATISGMVIYVFIAYKLAVSASPEELADPSNQMIMANIALYGPIIYFGLAAATISSALGSIMVAPRTLQALSMDSIFPAGFVNRWLKRGNGEMNEPFNATIITSLIAVFFVLMGDVNAVAEVISMFFMITYGSLCLISFLQHFAADPSYRPSFKSKWYLSLMGFVLCMYLMFSMNQKYAFISILFMVGIYILITYKKKDSEGLAKIFQGVIFQISRALQVFLQNADRAEENWRPSVICISSNFFQRPSAFTLLRWISHRYGFGTYIHFMKGYYSKESHALAKRELGRLIKIASESKSNVYIDTMISPSYTSSIAQAIQLPSVSGKDINMILFDFAKQKEDELRDIVDNNSLVKAAGVDICILASDEKEFGFHKNIHIWISPNDLKNGSLMVLMGYIIMGHKEWKNAEIKIFALFPEEQMTDARAQMLHIIKQGRLPISSNNVEVVARNPEVSKKDLINTKSKDADLTIIGFREELIKQTDIDQFIGYDAIGNVLFVNSSNEKELALE